MSKSARALRISHSLTGLQLVGHNPLFFFALANVSDGNWDDRNHEVSVSTAAVTVSE